MNAAENRQISLRVVKDGSPITVPISSASAIGVVQGDATVFSQLVPASDHVFTFGQSSNHTLITWSEIELLLSGTFALPQARDGDVRFGSSEARHCQLANGNLLVESKSDFQRQAEIALPTMLDGSLATRVGPWIDIRGGLLPDGWQGGPPYILGGMLPGDGVIYFTAHQFYNGPGEDWQTQGRYTGAPDGTGTTSVMWTVDHPLAIHQRVGGYMSRPPEVMRNAGYDYLAGLQGSAGNSAGRWGPNLFAIDVDNGGTALKARPLICHPEEEHLTDFFRKPATVHSMEWIEHGGKHGLLCMVRIPLGVVWYGLPTEGPTLDPYSKAKGYHAQGYALEAWIYEPSDLLEVYRGEREPWTLVPVEMTRLLERQTIDSPETAYSFLTGNPYNPVRVSCSGDRLLFLQEKGHAISAYESTPKGYVVDLGGPISN